MPAPRITEPTIPKTAKGSGRNAAEVAKRRSRRRAGPLALGADFFRFFLVICDMGARSLQHRPRRVAPAGALPLRQV